MTITADQLIAWRTRIGFCQGRVARYLNWELGVLIAYESGRPIPSNHAADLARMMRLDEKIEQPQRRGLNRRFAAGAPAHLSDIELMETYASLSKGPFDSLTQQRCLTRHGMLASLFRRQPKEF